jgi:hypothetical protein
MIAVGDDAAGGLGWPAGTGNLIGSRRFAPNSILPDHGLEDNFWCSRE